MKTYCFALDLQDDPGLIAEYRSYHQQENVWPEVLECTRDSGNLSEDSYLAESRLFMILQTTDDFSLEDKIEAGRRNPVMQKWEALMWTYQRPLPHARPNDKWVPMEKIFEVRS